MFISKYSPVVEEEVMTTLKEQLTSELILGSDPHITLWDDLPFISAQFNDVILMDATRLDTLLQAELCYVRLNIWEVLNGNYTISGIRVENGGLRIKQDELGQWNYKVWKEPEDQETSTGFRLKDLEMGGIQLDFINKKADLTIDAFVDEGTLDASFGKGEQTLVTDLHGHLKNLKSGRDLELIDLPFALAGVLDLNTDDGVYAIDMGNAVLAGNEMVWNATFTRVETGTDMNISVVASALRLETLLHRIWPDMPENIRALKLAGKTDLQLKMQGQFTKDSGPKTELIFDLKEGSMLLNDVRLQNIVLNGAADISDLKKVSDSHYRIDHFEVSTATGTSTGSFTLNSLENPHINLQAKGNAGLSELMKLAKMDPNASGSTNFNLQFKSPLGHRFDFGKKEIAKAELTGDIGLNNATFTVAEDVPTFRNINGNLRINSKVAEFKGFSGELGSTGFQADVTLEKPKQVMLNERAGIKLSGSANVDRLDLESLVDDWKNLGASSSGSSEERKLSGRINVSIDQLIYKAFTAEEISSNLNISNEGVTAHNLKMETMGGSVSGDVAYRLLSNGHNIGIDAELRQLSISRLFGEWDNFGQEFLKSDHLEGSANADVLCNIQLDNDLNVVSEKLTTDANLQIINGKLKGFEPLQALSKYIELEELQEVSFDTLSNTISMANSEISIPQMKIKSSALELNFFGKHGLDNDVDYHADLLLSDLLRRKAKQRKREIEGHEIVEPSGKTRLFLWIRGPLDDLKIGFDNKQVRKKLKNDMKEEGKLLKQIIAEEFHGEKPQEETKTEQPVEFRLEDDGLENETIKEKSTEAKEEKTKKKKKGGLFGWLKDEEEKQNEKESDFEIDFD